MRFFLAVLLFASFASSVASEFLSSCAQDEFCISFTAPPTKTIAFPDTLEETPLLPDETPTFVDYSQSQKPVGDSELYWLKELSGESDKKFNEHESRNVDEMLSSHRNSFFCVKNAYRNHEDEDLNSILYSTAINKGVDPFLFCAMLRQESNGNIKARGGDGECGLMQILPTHYRNKNGWLPYDFKYYSSYQQGVGDSDSCFVPENNFLASIAVLFENGGGCLKNLAPEDYSICLLQRYNGGPTGDRKPAARKYAREVMAKLEQVFKDNSDFVDSLSRETLELT